MELKNNLLMQLVMHRGVEVPAFMQIPVFEKYERYRIPDDKLKILSKEDLAKYVKGLYKCTCEMARDWTEGHKLLKELGFIEESVTHGHRRFTSLKYNE